MQLNLMNGTGNVDVSDDIFAKEFNEALVHQVVTAYLAGGRAGTKAQKTRAEVRGGGIKPWRQKGTGRARAGTIRSPIWRKGGVVFAAKPRDYSQKVNKKMYRAAIRSILSELVRKQRLHVLDGLTLPEPKTKLLIAKLKQWQFENALIIIDTLDSNIILASQNIPNIDVCLAQEINPLSLIKYQNVVITAKALKQVEEQLA